MKLLSSVARRLRVGNPSPIDGLDLTDQQFCQNPFPLYAQLRSQASVHRRPRDGQWFVFGYNDVEAALMQPQIFSSRQLRVFDPHLLGADPPAHTTSRKGTASELAALVPAVSDAVEPIAAELLAALAHRSEFDAVEDFIRPLIESVAGRILGFTETHVRALSAAVGRGRDELSGGYDNAVPPMEAALRELGTPRWMPEAMAGASLRQQAEFGRFIWTASTRTSRQTFSACLLAILQFPLVREQVLSNPALIPNLVEEIVRLDPGEHLLLRTVTIETQLSSARIPREAPVVLCVASANRDAARFTRPDEVVLDRVTNPQLGFGKGHHKCPGANIARAQVAAGLRMWLKALPHFHEAQPLSSVRYLGGPSMRILERLMIKPTI